MNITDNWAVDAGLTAPWPSGWTVTTGASLNQNIGDANLPGPTAGSQSNLSDSVGHIKSTASSTQTLAIYRNDTGSLLNSVQYVTFQVDTNADQVGLAARGASTVGVTNTYYSVQTGAAGTSGTLTIDRNNASGTSVSLGSYSLPSGDFLKNTWYTLEFFVHQDPTNTSLTDLAANVWATATASANPTGWQISTTDGTTGALQSAGTSGIWYKAGHNDNIDTTAYSLANSLPPTISTYTASTTSVARTSSVTFNATGVDSDIHPQALTNYTLNYGDGTTPLSQAGAISGVTHAYSLQGSYSATLTITDADGQTTSQIIPMTVTPKSGDHSASISSFTQSTTVGAASLAVTFNASGSASGDALSYNLNYGDGTTSLTQTSAITNVTHAFSQVGSYQAVLTVTDTVDGSSATQSQWIAATASPNSVPPDPFAESGGTPWNSLPSWNVVELGPVAQQTPMTVQEVGDDTGMTVNQKSSDTAYIYTGSYVNSVQQVSFDAEAGGADEWYQMGLEARANANSTTFYAVQTNGIGNGNPNPSISILKSLLVNNTATQTVLATYTFPTASIMGDTGLNQGTYYSLKFLVQTDAANSSLTDLKADLWPTGTTDPGWSMSITSNDSTLDGATGSGGIWEAPPNDGATTMRVKGYTESPNGEPPVISSFVGTAPTGWNGSSFPVTFTFNAAATDVNGTASTPTSSTTATVPRFLSRPVLSSIRPTATHPPLRLLTPPRSPLPTAPTV